MEAIITTATVLAMYFNVATTNNGGNYYYNAEVENNKVMNMNVLSNEGNYLSQKLQYRFTYDEQDRLSSKEALKWNADTQRWENYYVLDYAYTDGGYSVERRSWDNKSNDYAVAAERMEYKMVGENVLAVNHYKMSADNKAMELAGNMLVMNPQSDNLLAMSAELEK